MSTDVHKSGVYSNIEIQDPGSLQLPQGKMGETAAYGRPPGTEQRIAAYLLIEYLERIGVDTIFGLCGHTVIAFLDALGKSKKIKFISTRHEQVAAHAAEGYARVTGKPGVVMTHLGPGILNATTGVADAALDSIPMVVIAGDVPSYYFGRHPHQEVAMHMDADQYEVYRPFCKRIYRVDRVEDLPRMIERAFHLSMSGRPGPVLVDVPMDHFSSNLLCRCVCQNTAGRGQAHARSCHCAADRRGAGPGGTPRALCRRRRNAHPGQRRPGSPGPAGGSPGSARVAHADGQGLPAGQSSVAGRPDRILGHSHRRTNSAGMRT